MYCKNCGNEIHGNANFCPACGAKICAGSEENTKRGEVQCEGEVIPDNTASAESSFVAFEFDKPLENNESEVVIDSMPKVSDTEPHISDSNEARNEEKEITDSLVVNEQPDVLMSNSRTVQHICEKERKRSSKAVAVIFRVAAIIVTAVLFVMIVATSLYGALYTGFNPKNISEYLDKAEISNVVIGDKSFAEFIYEKCDKKIAEQYNITVDGIEEILSTPDTKSAISDIIMPYIDYYFGVSDSYPENSSESIIRIIKENEKAIERTFDYRMKDADYEFISGEAEMAFAEVSNFMKSSGNKTLRIILRRYLYVAMIVAAVLLGLLLFAANRFKMLRTLGDIGGAMIASAAVMLILLGYASVMLIFPFMPDYILEFIRPIRNAIAIRSLIFASVGFVVSAIYWSISSVKHGRIKKSA